ncbi:hypothetical protein HanIR_Chr16g0820881 [Helianthus annuus]|nr:hypothetical protein HanIR_Chr16g0820881 [Helianthus annuus]
MVEIMKDMAHGCLLKIITYSILFYNTSRSHLLTSFHHSKVAKETPSHLHYFRQPSPPPP